MGKEILKLNTQQYPYWFFDMDGTLVNSEPCHRDSLKELLDGFGIKMSIREMESRFIGWTDLMVYQDLFGDRPEYTLEKFFTDKLDYLSKAFNAIEPSAKETYVAKGTIELLEKLVEKGATLTIVSSSEKEVVDLTLKSFGLEKYFPTRIHRSSIACNKPNPSPYLFAMRKQNAHHSKSLIFEDSPTGIKSGHLSGAKTIQVTQFLPSGFTKFALGIKKIENYQNIVIE